MLWHKITVVWGVVMFGLIFTASAEENDSFGEMIELAGNFSERNFWRTDWSPDGETIAFGYDGDIWIVPATGGEPVNLTSDIVDRCFHPQYSPDGTELLITRRSQATSSQIDALDLATGESRRFIDNAMWASFSHDGRYIVYIKDGAQHAVYDTKTDSETLFDFPNNTEFDYGHSSFHPDNSHFVSTYRNAMWGASRLYSIPLNGDDSMEVPLGTHNYWYPDYSHDGEWLLYSELVMMDNRFYTWKRDMWVYHAPSGATYPLIDTGAADIDTYQGSWSPDDSKFCYIYNDGVRQNLYICSFDPENVLTTGIDKDTLVCITLNGTYPNPFNCVTTIQFSLPENAYTDVSVFNSLGQKIRTLVSRDLTSGLHSVVWDGRDRNGAAVASGVYISRLATEKYVDTGLMTYVK